MKVQTFPIVYDNGGKTADRYTVIYEAVRDFKWSKNMVYGHSPKVLGGIYFSLSVSEEPDHPQYGVSMYGVCTMGRHLGKRINWKDLPQNVREHVCRRFAEGGVFGYE